MADRTASMLLPVIAIPFGFVGALIVWLLKREDADVDRDGRATLDFTLLASGAQFILWTLGSILAAFASASAGGAFVLLAWMIWIVAAIFLVRAAMQASRGEPLRYPIGMRLFAKGT